VTDRQNGLFWLDSAIDVRQMLFRRKIIDDWCGLRRAIEERDYIMRDALLVKSHCINDMHLLRGECHYIDGLQREEMRCYQWLIQQEIDKISEQLAIVELFLLSIE